MLVALGLDSGGTYYYGGWLDHRFTGLVVLYGICWYLQLTCLPGVDVMMAYPAVEILFVVLVV